MFAWSIVLYTKAHIALQIIELDPFFNGHTAVLKESFTTTTTTTMIAK